MDAMEDLLKGKGFVRCHQSYIVQKQYVNEFSRSGMIIQDVQIPISRRYYDSLKKCSNSRSKGDEKVADVYLTQSLCMNQNRQGGIIGLKGTLIGRRIEIRNNVEVVLGRDPGQVDVVIHGSKVSRMHCGIRFNYYGNDYTICDYSKMVHS